MSGTKKIIDNFTVANGHGFLSNFHPSTFVYEGKTYRTVEHAYQCHKTLDEESRELIRKSRTPAEAKKLGRCLTLRPDWLEVRIPLMRDFIRKKFENPLLMSLLLGTGDAELVHGNVWNDRFWGVCRGTGENWLGVILMDVRKDLVEFSREENKDFELK